MADPLLLCSIDHVLAQQGLSFSELRQQASAIALFGSRAAGCARTTSDWDLFCVGQGRSRRIACVDLIWVDAPAIEHLFFLGGELAGHVAAHGTWLHGEPAFQIADVQFDTAAKRKEERLVKRLRSYEQTWHLLDRGYQEHDAKLLRRDAQRLGLLQANVAVPPSAHLDAAWDLMRDRASWLSQVLRALGTSPKLAAELSARATPSASLPTPAR